MHSEKHLTRPFIIAAALLAVALNAFADGSSGSGTVSITSSSAIIQNFDTLSNSTSPSNVLPTGWYLTEIGTGAAADGSYVVGTGSSNGGGAYSFGATGSTDRALGSLGSGSVTPIYYGAKLTNNTGATITAVAISYFGEMWRRGGPTGAELLTFAYSTTATDLTTGTYTTVAALNFNTLGAACSATTGVATDGNSAACRAAISATISGLAIPAGGVIWIRWMDVDTTGSDDGLAIDDVSITATSGSTGPTATATASPSFAAPGQSTTLSGTITAGQNPPSVSYTAGCNLSAIGGANPQAFSVTGTTFSYSATVALGVAPAVYSLPCTVTDDQNRTGNFAISLTVTAPFTCGAPATPIHNVQGSGAASPITGQVVEVEGIVVGAFSSTSQLSGFFLEEPVITQDTDQLTSEGVFIFTSGSGPSVSSGDRVRVRGTVAEFNSSGSSVTEIGTLTNVLVCSNGNPLPPPVTITLPIANTSDYERYEGMLVQFTQPLYVTGNFNLGTFGQVDLAPSVLIQATQSTGNNTSWAAATSLNSRSLIALDDDSSLSNSASAQNLYPTLFPTGGLSATNTLRVGARVNFDPNTNVQSPVIGILDERFGSYRIQPTQPVTFTNTTNPRPATAALSAALGGRYKLASANVLNFFTTLGKRGAQTDQELTNQRLKIIAELSKLSADVYGLSEVQNFANGNTTGGTYTNVTAADLTTNLATATGRNYQFIDTITAANIVGGDITQNGTDAIRSVIVYDAGRVTPVGPAALYYQNGGHRASIAQTFKPASGAKADQQTFTFVVNHIRSRSSACGTGDDDTYQGNCNGTRLSMTSAVRNWLSTNPTSDPAGANRKVILVGDFNAYFGEDPIQALTGAGGYTDLINLLIGANASSYNFGSQDGYLDHGFANAAALPLVKNVIEIHNNAEEPASLQALNTAAKPAPAITTWFAPDEYAASDHDPFLVAFNPLAGDLNDDGAVDLLDRNVLIANYGKPASQVDRRMDYDGDGVITPNDYRVWFNLYRAFIQ